MYILIPVGTKLVLILNNKQYLDYIHNIAFLSGENAAC